MTFAIRLLTALVLGLGLGPAGAALAGTGRIAIFYYPWYSTPASDGSYAHWDQWGHSPPADISSDFYPARGTYSSADARVLDGQMAEIAAAGIDEVISSWWGSGSPEDQRLSDVIGAARAHGLAVAVQIEPYPGRTAQTVGMDIERLRTLGITSFYVYQPLGVPDADWAAVNSRLEGVTVFAQTALAGHAAAGRFAGLYTYDILIYGGATFARICSEAHRSGLLCAPSVGPGYVARRARGDTRIKPRLAGATYDSMWSAALRAEADQVTITSYNEWHEGTQIEPARAFRDASGLTYSGYVGTYGLKGAAARTAYLERTAYWARLFTSRQ